MTLREIARLPAKERWPALAPLIRQGDPQVIAHAWRSVCECEGIDPQEGIGLPQCVAEMRARRRAA